MVYCCEERTVDFMRFCLRCQAKMMEGAYLNIPGKLFTVDVKTDRGSFSPFDRFPLKAAVCPNCGEVSIHIEDHKDFAEKANKSPF